MPLLVLGAVVVLVLAVAATRNDLREVAQTLLQGSFGSPRAIAGTLREATPRLLTGLAVFLALRCGLFNIGVEGQFLIGAMAAAAAGLAVPGPLGLVLALVVGVVAGGAWALPAGLIKAYRGGHEVISTIMLNNVAVFAASGLVAGPLKDPKQDASTTATVAAVVPNLTSDPRFTLSLATFVAMALVGVGAIWLRRSVAGYELQAVGANPRAAEFAGVDARRVSVLAMLASGGLAGLGGALQVLAFEHRFYPTLSSGYGFDGLGIALLAGPSALGVIPGAILFGALERGGTQLAILAVPKGIVTVVIGLVILVGAAIRYRRLPAVG